jgi:hypothetical protein
MVSTISITILRQRGNTFSLVVVNFTDQPQTTSFVFPIAGNYVEQIEGTQNLNSVVAGAAQTIAVPSNYGLIWTVGG